MSRRHFKRGEPSLRVIDYRHLIPSLVKKPQAFRHSVFRDDLFPRPAFRRAWEKLDATLDPRKACRVYVGLLHLAAMHACEVMLADYLDEVMDADRIPELEAARIAIAPPPVSRIPVISIAAPNPAIYDGLLQAGTRRADRPTTEETLS